MQKRKPGQPHKGWKSSARLTSGRDIISRTVREVKPPIVRPTPPSEEISDVVRRLRARADGVDQFYGAADEELDREAIAEIERLQRDNSRLERELGRNERNS